jgi:type IV pilus assembly protein PilC
MSSNLILSAPKPRPFRWGFFNSVLSTAGGVVLFMLRFIVPMFADVCRRFGRELPPLTRAIVGLSGAVREHALTGALLLLGRWMVQVPACCYWLIHLLLRVPGLGAPLRGAYLERLGSSLALLTGAHVPLLQALDLARQMLGFAPLTRALEAVEALMLLGASLHESLREFRFLFDARLVALVKVGEEVNKLDCFFQAAGSAGRRVSKHGVGVIRFIGHHCRWCNGQGSQQVRQLRTVSVLPRREHQA